jgi:hypothetical protein
MGNAGQEDESRRPRVAFFNYACLAGERGVALARLDKPAAAQPVLESALESLDPEMVKTRPRLLAALATAHVRQGNLDQACRFGADALVLTERQQVTSNLEDLCRLVSILSPGATCRRSGELDEQLAAVGGGRESVRRRCM